MSVIFGQDALSESTVEGLFAYIENQKKHFVWASNFLLWEPILNKGNGVVLTHKLSNEWTASLYRELHERGKLTYIPSDAIAMYYAWFGGSHIAWHSDYLDKHSMTIYLTKDWHPDHGGYFCWKNWDESMPKHIYREPPAEANMRLPVYNGFVHITEAEWHTTTLTALSAPPRLSLQLFFGME